MKKLLLILLFVPIMFACGSDNDDDNPKGYTSFQIKNDSKKGTYYNVVAGYRLADGTLKLRAKLGDIAPGKNSDKIDVTDTPFTIKQIEVFSDYKNEAGDYGGTDELTIIEIKKDKNNVFTIPAGYVTDKNVDKNNPQQYPQE